MNLIKTLLLGFCFGFVVYESYESYSLACQDNIGFVKYAILSFALFIIIVIDYFEIGEKK